MGSLAARGKPLNISVAPANEIAPGGVYRVRKKFVMEEAPRRLRGEMSHLGGERLDARGEARKFTAHGIACDNAA